MPKGAIALKNDRSSTSFIGAAPPAGTGEHRYHFVIYALDVSELDIPTDATPAFFAFNALSHTLGWARIIATYQQQ